jgi:hypothetical protein
MGVPTHFRRFDQEICANKREGRAGDLRLLVGEAIPFMALPAGQIALVKQASPINCPEHGARQWPPRCAGSVFL